ncbi:scarecrow-like protein 9 isoform X1 [Canna indica]|uniref:Scarecrow-like protein 9 isoform X1 n=1 Tax=Canna indica TaxID=4628 RepID=A0AAQ3KTQ7_9LILI|nr:scarecrow-like protein 9 isoform X1 [Canna indica]
MTQREFRRDIGSGVGDLTGVMNGFSDEQHFPDFVNANSFKPKGPPPPPPPPPPPLPITVSQQIGLVDLQDGTFLQAPSDSVSVVNASTSFTALLNEGFNYDHLFTEDNALSSLELEEQLHFSNQSELLGLPNFESGSYPFVSTSNPDLVPSQSASTKEDSPDDSEFSDILLRYMQTLMESVDEKINVNPENPPLLAAEQPFLGILGENLPISPDKPTLCSNHVSDSPDGSISDNHSNSSGSAELQVHPLQVHESSQSSFSPIQGFDNIVEGGKKSLLGMLAAPDSLPQVQPTWQFQRGLHETQKLLSSKDTSVIDLEADDFYFPQDPHKERNMVVVEEENKNREHAVNSSRGQKNPHGGDLDLEEGRSIKQSAIYADDTCRTPMFDEILLCHGEICTEGVDGFGAKTKNGTSKTSRSNNTKGSSGGKGRGKKQPKGEIVDLRTLLIHCAQAVAADEHRNANELLKQIRQHSSPHGDANQRLAHWFADGLQARLAGTGSQIYHSLVAKRISVTDVIKSYKLYTIASPFRKISHFFSTQNILNVSGSATRIHIIDFGIYYGLQWPCFLQRLSKRFGTPPKVCMTGIDLPVPGFRPAELIDETGRRLADYARSFNIPFEFRSIASAKWETIRVEDLDLRKDEVLVVNCLFRFKSLMDETVSADNPRDMVLNTIRKMNPDLFVHGIVNGTYGVPFFVTRFREALFHYSSMFDMIETNVQHEDELRQLIEKVLFGREALNVIACEGTERLERPETYKQWHVRNLRAGFMQLPLNRDIVKKAKDKVKSCYHKDFVVDEGSGWLLQGWKGRILYALSTWKSSSC